MKKEKENKKMVLLKGRILVIADTNTSPDQQEASIQTHFPCDRGSLRVSQ